MLRTALGLNASFLMAHGIPHTRVSEWENGVRDLQAQAHLFDPIIAISKSHGVTHDWLLTGIAIDQVQGGAEEIDFSAMVTCRLRDILWPTFLEPSFYEALPLLPEIRLNRLHLMTLQTQPEKLRLLEDWSRYLGYRNVWNNMPDLWIDAVCQKIGREPPPFTGNPPRMELAGDAIRAIRAGGYEAIHHGYRRAVSVEFTESEKPTHEAKEIAHFRAGAFAGKTLMILPLAGRIRPEGYEHFPDAHM